MSLPLLRIALAILAFAGFVHGFVRRRRQKSLEAALAKQHGCQPIMAAVPYEWPFAIDLIKVQFKAYLNNRNLEDLSDYILKAELPNGSQARTMRLELWGVTGIITHHPENLEAVLKGNFDDYGMGSRSQGLLPFLREGIFTQDGPAWKRSREVINQQFMRIKRQSPQNLTSHVDDLISALKRACADGQAVNLKPHFFEFTLGTTTELIFGESLNVLSQADRDAFRDAFDYGSWACGIRLRLADLAFLYNPRKFREACKIVQDTAGYFSGKALRFKDEVGEEAASEKYAFIVDLWKDMQDPELVRDQLLHILIAGRDTTACLLSWTFFHLVRNPDILLRLRREVATVPFHEPLNRDQIQGLRYLRCCLNETLRLYPQLPINVRYANKATVLPKGGGLDGKSPILVPKGCGIGWSAYHLHRYKDMYGEDLGKFRPERWEDGSLWKKAGLGGFLDFHGGARRCLGEDFALMETSYATIRILQTFPNLCIPLGVPNKPIGDEEHSLSILLAPKDGVDVLLN